MGQGKRESVYKGKYIELRDSLYSASTQQQINRLTIELSQQKNITTISDQKKLANLQQQLIAQHVFQKRLTISIAILLSVIVILLVLGYIRKVRFENLLESKVKQRTLELEANRNELQLALHQHRQFIQHVCLDAKGITDNLTGLRHLADLDITDPQAREYFSQIGSINNRMFQLLNQLKEPRFGQDT
ncbi:MAG TPA: hypothetical protein DCE81_14075 [Cytophagales bacterium]|nr:hypothetical protein [Cytophagales bacterium]